MRFGLESGGLAGVFARQRRNPDRPFRHGLAVLVPLPVRVLPTLRPESWPSTVIRSVPAVVAASTAALPRSSRTRNPRPFGSQMGRPTRRRLSAAHDATMMSSRPRGLWRQFGAKPPRMGGVRHLPPRRDGPSKCPAMLSRHTLAAQRHHWLDGRCTPGRNDARDQPGKSEDRHRRGKKQRTVR